MICMRHLFLAKNIHTDKVKSKFSALRWTNFPQHKLHLVGETRFALFVYSNMKKKKQTNKR